MSDREPTDADAAASPYAHLQVETTPGGVRTITLDRPARLNAVNPPRHPALPARTN